MKASKKTAEAQKNREQAEGLLLAKGHDTDEQEALFAVEAMLGGLLLMRTGAEMAESWGRPAGGIQDDLAPHLDGIEAVLKKYRDDILCRGQPEQATA